MVPLIVAPCSKTPRCVLEQGHTPPCKLADGQAVRAVVPAGKPFSVTLLGERGREWQNGVGTCTLPVTKMKPEPASVMGSVVMAYYLDLRRVTPQLRDRIEHFLAERLGRPLDHVHAEILEGGVPIIAKHLVTPEGYVYGDE